MLMLSVAFTLAMVVLTLVYAFVSRPLSDFLVKEYEHLGMFDPSAQNAEPSAQDLEPSAQDAEDPSSAQG